MATNTQYSYEKDYYGWLKESADRLKNGDFANLDFNHVAEELEDMGRSQKQQLANRLALLIAHLLKWEFQPEKQSNSWRLTIKEQRYRIKKILKESPSLKHEINETIAEAYGYAVFQAARETQKVEEDFPLENPYSFEQLLNEVFFPGQA